MLSIGVAGASQIQHSTRVSNTGKIHVPYVGVIKVVDMTVPELQAEIARQLRERGLVHDAWVSVRIDQYRAQPVYVLGEVMTPGQFVIKDEMYLTDLLTLAAGFNDVASPIGYLYRRKANTESLQPGEAPTDEAIAIDFQALNEGTRPELNLRLRGGDVLYVPQRRREFYFVVGDVGKPGVYEIKKAAGTIRLSQALAQTGGPLPTAKMSAGILVRFDQAGGRQELPVDFKAILEGRQPDLSVQANDIVFIPGSSAKTLALGLLGVIPGLVGQRTTDSLR
jgi:polysaccharide export outer membrane protein